MTITDRIKKSDNVNCDTSNTFRRPIRENTLRLLTFFNTFTGWKAERTIAGKKPARIPTTTAKRKKMAYTTTLASRSHRKMRAKFNWRIIGLIKYSNTDAITNASKATITDSDKNWTKICQRAAPVTLRTPISRALVSVRAIDRFVKLKQDVSRITMANPPRK